MKLDLSKLQVLNKPFLQKPAKLIAEGELNTSLLNYYADPSWIVQFMATLINSALISDKPAFTLSYKIMKYLVENDLNLITKRSIDGKEFKIFRDSIDGKIITAKEKSSDFGVYGKRRAGLYVFCDDEVRKYFKDIEAKENAIYLQYCKDNKLTPKNVSVTKR